MINRRAFTIGIASAHAAAISAALSVTVRNTRAANKKSVTIEIDRFKFTGPEEQLSVGDEITWINRDIAPHTATAEDNSWDSGRLNTGESWAMMIEDGQSANYFCRFHPMMKARLPVA